MLLLDLFADRYKDIAGDVRKIRRFFEKKYLMRASTPDAVRIVAAIQEGYATAAEIAAHTLIPYVTVTKVLRELKALGAITSTRRPVDMGKGGDKKTELHWAADKARAVLKQRYPSAVPNK